MQTAARHLTSGSWRSTELIPGEQKIMAVVFDLTTRSKRQHGFMKQTTGVQQDELTVIDQPGCKFSLSAVVPES